MEEQGTRASIERRLERTEKDISDLVNITSAQGRQVASISTSIDQMSRQVNALFSRIDQPVPWGVIFTGVGLMVMILSLAFAPVVTNILELKDDAKTYQQHLVDDAYSKGETDATLLWLKSMEGRYYDRVFLPDIRRHYDDVHSSARPVPQIESRPTPPHSNYHGDN